MKFLDKSLTQFIDYNILKGIHYRKSCSALLVDDYILILGALLYSNLREYVVKVR
jgi:hypothetical protein